MKSIRYIRQCTLHISVEHADRAICYNSVDHVGMKVISRCKQINAILNWPQYGGTGFISDLRLSAPSPRLPESRL
jgi:hypothetical protein